MFLKTYYSNNVIHAEKTIEQKEVIKKMYKGVECKIYPNQAQIKQIHMTFGHTRFVWNEMLNMLQQRYQNNPKALIPKGYALINLLTQMKREYTWLKDVDSIALQNTTETLALSYQRFFKKLSKYPKFKTKHQHKQSYTTVMRNAKTKPNIRFNENQRYLKIPKIGWVKCRKNLDHVENERIKLLTITHKSTGEYYASIIMESDTHDLPKTGRNVGIDLGLTDLGITSDGERFKSQRLHLKYKKQLHYWEVRQARRGLQAKAKGIPLTEAKNYQEARRQVARIYQKITNVRKDYIHKITTDLVERYDTICIEDLKSSNMMSNHNLARSISQQSWYLFRRTLEYKCLMYGKKLIIVNPYKTSQICSSCGYDSGKKALNIRAWTCPNCNAEHDRDINASINILNKGLNDTKNEKETVESV